MQSMCCDISSLHPVSTLLHVGKAFAISLALYEGFAVRCVPDGTLHAYATLGYYNDLNLGAICLQLSQRKDRLIYNGLIFDCLSPLGLS